MHVQVQQPFLHHDLQHGHLVRIISLSRGRKRDLMKFQTESQKDVVAAVFGIIIKNRLK